MRAEIISIGTELLVGSILNTNARFLSERLAESAIDVYHQVTIGDNRERILEALRTAAARADLVITTGGLGPTEDDITMRVLAEFAGRQLVLHRPTHRHVKSRLAGRGYTLSPLGVRQCYVPKGSTVMRNDHGTAPAILLKLQKLQGQSLREGLSLKWILALPGPPSELEPIFTKKALPLLLKKARLRPESFVVRTVRITGRIELQVAEKVTDLLKWRPPLTVGIYAKRGEVELKIMAKAASRRKALIMADRTERIIRGRLGDAVFGVDKETLSSAVGELLLKNRKTVSLAESCSGGLVSSRLTDTPGSSDYFKGGVVCYSDRSKTALLGVDPKLIARHGAVSRAVAVRLAGNVRQRFDTDFGVGITGIAGPAGGSRKKQVGLVYIAVAGGSGTLCREFRFHGSRAEVRAQSARTALDLLRLKLKNRL